MIPNSEKAGDKLREAIRNGWNNIITALLTENTRGIPGIDLRDHDGNTALMLLIANIKTTDQKQANNWIAVALLDRGASCEVKNNARENAFSLAVKNDNYGIVQEMLQRGIVSASSIKDAFAWAVKNGHKTRYMATLIASTTPLNSDQPLIPLSDLKNSSTLGGKVAWAVGLTLVVLGLALAPVTLGISLIATAIGSVMWHFADTFLVRANICIRDAEYSIKNYIQGKKIVKQELASGVELSAFAKHFCSIHKKIDLSDVPVVPIAHAQVQDEEQEKIDNLSL